MARKNRKKTKPAAKKRSPKKTAEKARAGAGGRQHEIFGLVFSVAAAIVLLALASFDPADPALGPAGGRAHNLVGLVGAYLADGLLFTLGVSAFLLVAGLVYAAAVAFTRGALPVTGRKVAGFMALLVQGTALFHIALAGEHLLGHAPGGVLGEYAGGLFVSLLSTTGSVVTLIAGICVALIATTGFSLTRVGRTAWTGLRFCGQAAGRGLAWLAGHLGRALAAAARATGAWLAAQGREFTATLRSRSERVQPSTVPGSASLPPMEIDASEEAPAVDEKTDEDESDLVDFLKPPVSCPPELGRREPVVVTGEAPGVDDKTGPTEMDEPPLPVEPPALVTPRTSTPPEPAETENASPADEQHQEPEIVIPRHQRRSAEDADQATAIDEPDWANFKLPSLDMLAVPEEEEEDEIDKDQLTEYARRLDQKLADYGIKGKVTKIMPGPVVTMYEYAPGPGIKVAKIAGLSQDLALALEAISVRIIAPIPGRAVVGIEVSNKKRKVVYGKEIIGHKSFRRSKSKLTLALGKDIEGAPYVTDLNKMPHLLVAGATGTGKSVALNSMITSILYKASPEDVRFIMVDPKVLELSLYEGIPHLLLPVVTDPRKAQAALQWAVNEMERRIQILHGAGVRNLDSFNRKAEKQAEGDPEPAPKRRKKKIKIIDKTAEGTQDELVEAEVDAAADQAAPGEEEIKRLEKMPHIVIVIDELADLMMTCGREVETNIARIAQKARAAGIHLIVATQRPSVNVITGLIKANLPARVSFRVASKVDSRTILDTNGAEALLGNGDMLFHPPTSSELVRVHGAFISEDEITEIVEHLKEQAEPVYDETIIAAAEQEDGDGEEAEEDEYQDPLYDEAVQVVAEQGQASTSMVQRKLRIGYNRAARLIEQMEKEGIVGPPDGSRPRKVLIQNHSP